MLSLITAEQSGPALINSTDMTIRNPSRKDHTVIEENAPVFHQTPPRTHPHLHTQTHTPGINCCGPRAAGRRATALTGKVSIVTARWAEMMLIVEL